jgi:hypothetical protein
MDIIYTTRQGIDIVLTEIIASTSSYIPHATREAMKISRHPMTLTMKMATG